MLTLQLPANLESVSHFQNNRTCRQIESHASHQFKHFILGLLIIVLRAFCHVLKKTEVSRQSVSSLLQTSFYWNSSFVGYIQEVVAPVGDFKETYRAITLLAVNCHRPWFHEWYHHHHHYHIRLFRSGQTQFIQNTSIKSKETEQWWTIRPHTNYKSQD